MTAQKQATNRKPYRRPELVVHGNVVEVTRAVGRKGAKDGGRAKTQKTGP